MSTGLVLGTVGSIVGGMIGGPIGASVGYLIGSLIGNLIDPPKTEGPRLNDLKLQTSTYGKIIPIVWGKGRIAGNVIDQTDLQEHKQKSGGKGGPQVTSYTYSASFDILLCEGPILGISRIWADGKVIWSAGTGEECPCTVYLGSDDQEPDPTFEAIHGVGNVPAYNGYAHVVFADYYLTDFGNRIPQLEFEVYTNVGVFPYRVSAFTPGVAGAGTEGVVYANGSITVASYGPGSTYYERVFDIDGVEDTSAAYDSVLDLPSVFIFPMANLAAASSSAGWYVRDAFTTSFVANPDGGALSSSANGHGAVYKSDNIYAIGVGATSNVFVARWPATGGVISTETGLSDAFYDFGYANNQTSAFKIGTSNNDKVYVTDFYNSPLTLKELDLDLNLVRSWDLDAEYAILNIVNGHTFTVYQQSNGALVFAVDRGTAGSKQAFCFYLNDDLTLTQISGLDSDPLGSAQMGPIIELGVSGYALTNDGVICLEPPAAGELLSTIIADLTEMTPLGGGSPLQYDVSELTDQVRWFAVASNMPVRNAIESLRPIFFFDAVEVDYRVVFRKRGGSVEATIPDEDLCAREYGSDSKDPLLTIRKREQNLPRLITMTFYDVEADYQIGAQSSPRQTTQSEQDVTMDVPVGLTNQEASQKCWVVLSSEWIERENFEFSLSNKWCKLTPCTVVDVRGRGIRILTSSAGVNGVTNYTGVLSAPSIYTQTGVGSGSVGFVEQNEFTTIASTELVLLDIPILSQHDAPFGFYAAMGPATVGRWSGATLYKSLDNGSTYNAVTASSDVSVIGHTDDAPSSPSVSGVLAGYSGGDVVDESELCVVLTDADTTLESCNSTALSNGANLCALSRGVSGSPATMKWELLQFRDATLVANKTYVLKGFLRGRKGTLTTDHADGDTFVLLPVTNVDAPESELNVSLKYKAVTFGKSLTDTAAQDFINTGLSAEEYYETEVGHLPVYGENPGGSPAQLGPGLVPPPHGDVCDPTYFLNECGEWTVPAGGGGGGSPSGGGATNLTMPSGFSVSGSGTDTIIVTGGPAAQFIVMAPDADLPNELVATSNGNITVTAPGGSPSGQVVWDLTTTGVTPGGYGSSNDIPIIYVDAYGRVTSITSTALVGRIITEYEHTVIDTQCLALNFTGAAFAWDEGGGVTGIHVPYSAPIDGPFVLAASMGSPNLTGARVLTAGSGVTITDNGAGSTLVVGVSSSVATKVIQFACSDLTTALTPGTNKAVFRMPYAMSLTEVRASLATADTGSPTSGITIDINEGGTSILSTKLTIDGGEKTSTTAATPAVISDASLADDAEITVDIDAVGGNAKGLVVCLIGT